LIDEQPLKCKTHAVSLGNGHAQRQATGNEQRVESRPSGWEKVARGFSTKNP